MIKLTHKMLLLSALAAAAAGCAEGTEGAEGDESAEIPEYSEAEARQFQTDAKDEVAAAAAEGESFEAAGDEAAAQVEALPPPLLAESVSPSIQNAKRNGNHQTRSFNTSGAGKSYGGGTVFYPVDGDNLAGVVMCPGFTALKSSIRAWGPWLASHGIVLYTIDTKTPMDIVQQRGGQITEAMKDLQGFFQNRQELRGRGGDKWGTSGWSMGGGGTWLTAANQAGNLKLKTAITLAGHHMSAGGAGAVGVRNIRIPTLMMNGSTDVTILGGMGQTRSAYQGIPNSTPKLAWETGSCGHFCWGGPGQAGGGMSGVLFLAWQKTYLEGDESWKSLLAEQSVKSSGSRTTLFLSNVN